MVWTARPLQQCDQRNSPEAEAPHPVDKVWNTGEAQEEVVGGDGVSLTGLVDKELGKDDH